MLGPTRRFVGLTVILRHYLGFLPRTPKLLRLLLTLGSANSAIHKGEVIMLAQAALHHVILVHDFSVAAIKLEQRSF